MLSAAKAELFWGWLAANSPRIGDAMRALREAHAEGEVEQALVEELMGEVHAELQACDERAFPLLGITEDDVLELVITAEGNAEAFDDIKALVDAAPALPGWRLIALKPRIPLDQFREMSMLVDGVDVTPGDVRYALDVVGGRAGLTLVVDAAIEAHEEALAVIASLFLDQLLGEEMAALGVATLDCCLAAEAPAGLATRPLVELQAEFDRRLRN